MGETGKSFRESWAQRLADADTVTENDILSLYADFRPEVAARASSGYLAARENGDKRLVLDHATSDVAANLMVAAKAAVELYEGLRNNTNTSNTALAQSQVAGTVTQGNLTAAMAQLMAYQAAKAAAQDYEREIVRRQELARWVETHQRAEIAFAAQQAGLDARHDTLREGLLFRIPALYGGPPALRTRMRSAEREEKSAVFAVPKDRMHFAPGLERGAGRSRPYLSLREGSEQPTGGGAERRERDL